MFRAPLVLLVACVGGCASSDARPPRDEGSRVPALALSSSVQTLSPVAPPVTEPEASDSAAPPASATVADPAGEPKPHAVVRFVCDDKYVAEEPCDEVSWRAQVAHDLAAHNLLDHDMGGPDGAIWNGNAPMVVIVPEEAQAVIVGTTPLQGVRTAGLKWFRVPTETWRGALRAVPKKPYRSAPVRVDGKLVGEIWYAEGE